EQNQVLASQGYSQSAISGLGYGPSEFLLTAGTPGARVNVFDAGVYLQDDWRIKPNLSLSGGLRYETQSSLADHGDFAPRLGLAWAPGARGTRTPKTVIRTGAGFFYDRFTTALLMNATLLDGISRTQYIVRNPDFYPAIPNIAALQGNEGSHIRY